LTLSEGIIPEHLEMEMNTLMAVLESWTHLRKFTIACSSLPLVDIARRQVQEEMPLLRDKELDIFVLDKPRSCRYDVMDIILGTVG
jgi:hypothetical protein